MCHTALAPHTFAFVSAVLMRTAIEKVACSNNRATKETSEPRSRVRRVDPGSRRNIPKVC